MAAPRPQAGAQGAHKGGAQGGAQVDTMHGPRGDGLAGHEPHASHCRRRLHPRSKQRGARSCRGPQRTPAPRTTPYPTLLDFRGETRGWIRARKVPRHRSATPARPAAPATLTFAVMLLLLGGGGRVPIGEAYTWRTFHVKSDQRKKEEKKRKNKHSVSPPPPTTQQVSPTKTPSAARRQWPCFQISRFSAKIKPCGLVLPWSEFSVAQGVVYEDYVSIKNY